MSKNKLDFAEALVSHLSGLLAGGADIVDDMVGKDLADATILGDELLAEKAQAFNKSWNFRRKYFVKDMKQLATNADGFLEAVLAADSDAEKFLKKVRAQARESM